jgi:hypothetical protein
VAWQLQLFLTKSHGTEAFIMKSKTVRTLLAAAVVTVASASITGCYYYDDHDHWRRGYYYGDGYRYGYYDRDDYWRYRPGYYRDDYWRDRYSRLNRDRDHDND